MTTLNDCCPIQEAIDLFYQTFPCENEIPRTQLVIAAAPGRVNLIGEHTDYNDGFVLPLALDKNTVIVGIKAPDDTSRVVSTKATNMAVFQADQSLTPGKPSWANYIKGVAANYLNRFKSNDSLNVWAAIVTRVPLGGGLSSSASLEVSFATFLEAAFDFSSVDPKEKALLCQKCEHDYCHVPCGIMDQYISSCGQLNCALLIDCRTKEAIKVPFLDPNVVIVVSNSNVQHELIGSEYKDRVQQCKEAVVTLQNKFPDLNITHLRDVTMDHLHQVKDQLPPLVYRRARHVISENKRTVQAMKYIKAKEYEKVGELMYASHKSLKEDYEVSTPQLDALVEIARKNPGVYGARMTGGGFGGCIVVLIRQDQAEELICTLNKGYPTEFFGEHNFPTPTSFVTRIGYGARILKRANDTQDPMNLSL
jgi:galactokinase